MVEDSINLPFQDKGRVIWQACAFAIFCSLWLERNSGIFRDMEMPASEVWEIFN